MQVTEIKSEGLSREYKVALPAKEIEEKISYRLQELAKSARMPGFRPGKVPVSLLRKRYGPSIMGEILESAVTDSAKQALAEKGIRPAVQPQFEITEFEDGKDLTYTMSLEVLPEIAPVDFGKIQLERMTPKVDEKDVEEALKRIADANKSSTPITSPRKTQKGDVVVLNFVGKIDGEAFPGGSAEGYQLELGSGSFIPGFEDQLVGVDADTDVEVKVKFPEAYGAAELAGKDAIFECKVTEIREAAPSAIDDELAKKAGLENLDKLKETIREEQSREFKNLARMRVKRDLLDALADMSDFPVPAQLSDQEYHSIVHQWQHDQHGSDAAHADHHDHEEAHKFEPSEDEQQEFRDLAERRVRLGLLLSEIGRTNGITIAQDDINKAMMNEARKYPGQEQQVIEYFKKNPQALEYATAPIYEDKVVDFVIEMSKVTDKAVSMEELMKAFEEDSAESGEGEEKKAAPKKKAATKKKAAAKKKAADKDE